MGKRRFGSPTSSRIGSFARVPLPSLVPKDRVFFDEEIDDEWTPPTCSRWSAYAHGGRGRDQIFGGVGNDRLIGGPGKDVVDGSTGRDACQAEKRRSCEKKI